MWSRLKHVNILSLVGFTTQFSGSVSLVSPWHPGGTATAYVDGKPKETLLNIASFLDNYLSHVLELSSIITGSWCM